MSSPENFALKDLILSEDLQLHSTVANFDAVFDEILPRDGDAIEAPLIVGIDGSVTAGKSFAANSLLTYLSRREIDRVAIHGDWFMSPRRQRGLEVEKAMKGSYDISDYDAAACDFNKLRDTLHSVKESIRSKNGRARIVVPGAYSRATGECDEYIDMALPEKPVVICEGTGVLSPIMSGLFDLCIRVDVGSYDETVRRLEERELEKVPSQRLDHAFVKGRYDLIDYPYDQYLRSRDRRNFDVLLDTSDVTAIGVYKR